MKATEFQLSHVNKNGDVEDCDHRDTYKEAKKEFDKDNDWNLLEKVTKWGDEAGETERELEILIDNTKSNKEKERSNAIQR